MKELHSILCLLMLFSAFLAAFSRNPVESVLFLILAFCDAGAILFLYNLEFFGLLFIIIYVGAIAVLFLFVIMMLNIKLQSSFLGNLNAKNPLLYIVSLLLVLILSVNSYVYFFASFNEVSSTVVRENTFSVQFFDNFSNLDVLGQVFYNYYLMYLSLAGFILLIALLGAIVLTLNFNKPKKAQIDSKQLSRTDSFISFFNTKSN
jgi:NADH-quinone oxidoreductase subunit J